MRKLWSDLKKLWRHAALIGSVLAVLCRVVPAPYHVACDLLAEICRSGTEGNHR
jgi:hypothetical protein